MLELIFRGFFEWIYGLLVDVWEFIAVGLLDIMSLDFAYIRDHVPIIPQISQILLAVGWALLLGNLVFQALKSMAAGLGFEGEDPRLLFSRTFVFSFLLMASPQICRIGLDLTSNIMDQLSIPDATNVGLVDEGIFGTLTAAWIMAIICNVIVMFKVLGLVIEVAERYVILAMLTITAPLAFAMGGSKNTASIFSGWCRMFGSMCLLMVTNLVCCKMMFSALSTVPSGLDVLPWMVLIFAIVKVAKKSDAIITRIGLNPAITGGGKSLLGMLAATVVHTVVGQAVKGLFGGGGGGRTSAGASLFGNKGPGLFSRFFGGGVGGSQSSGSSVGGARYGSQSADRQSARRGAAFSTDSRTGTGGVRHSSQSTARQSTGGGSDFNSDSRTYAGGGRKSPQSTARQSATGGAGLDSDSRTDTGGGRYTGAQQGKTFQSASRQSASRDSTFNSSGRTYADGGRSGQTRRSSVPPGTHRSPSHVPPTGSTSQASGTSNTQTPLGQSKASISKQPDSPRHGTAGTAASKGGALNTVKPHPSSTGTQSAHSTQTVSQTVSGGTVNNSTQTNVTAGREASGAAAPCQPRSGGSAISISPTESGKVRSTKRENTGAVSKTSTVPASGSLQPGPAGTAARSTQRPSETASRSGRNIPSAAPTPSGSASSPGPARQERSPGLNRTAVSGTASGPARQEHGTGPNRTAVGGTASGPAGTRSRSQPRSGERHGFRSDPAGTRSRSQPHGGGRHSFRKEGRSIFGTGRSHGDGADAASNSRHKTTGRAFIKAGETRP